MFAKGLIPALLGIFLVTVPVVAMAAQQTPEQRYLQAVYNSVRSPAVWFYTYDECVRNDFIKDPILNSPNLFRERLQTLPILADTQRPKDVTNDQIIQMRLKSLNDIADFRKKPNFKVTREYCKSYEQGWASRAKQYGIK